MIKPTIGQLLWTALFLACFFGLAAVAEYAFVRWQVRASVLSDLQESAATINSTIAYEQGVNLEQLNRALIDTSDYFAILSDGTLLDVATSAKKGLLRDILPPVQPAFDAPSLMNEPRVIAATVAGHIENWTLFARKLDSGIAVIGISSFDTVQDAVDILRKNMQRTTDKLSDWEKISPSAFDTIVQFAVVGGESELVNAYGRIPLKTDPMAIGRHSTGNPDLEIKGQPYVVSYSPLTDKSGRAVGTIIVMQTIAKETQVLGAALLFDAVLASGSFLLFLLIAARYFSKHERERREIREAFQKYLSPKILEAILRDPDQLTLGGQRREVTILFSDIRSFTSLSERLPPQQLTQLLQEYFEAMTEEVLKEDGILDKYIGDAIMAFWGAPIEQKDQADRAVRAAQSMMRRLSELTESWQRKGYPIFDIGIGINLGVATVGNMGSSMRFDYTAVGDTVNAASRLEQLTKEYKNHIIISESTKRQLTIDPRLKDLGEVTVKGKEKPIHVFEVLLD